MAEQIYLKTDGLSSRSLNMTLNDVQTSKEALLSIINHGSVANATYFYNGRNHSIFSADIIEEATSIEIQLEAIETKIKTYSNILHSGPSTLQNTDEQFKGTFSNPWQRILHGIRSGVSIIFDSTVGFCGSLFRKGGKRTNAKTIIKQSENNSPISYGSTNGDSIGPEEKYHNDVTLINQKVPIGEPQYLNWCTGCSRATLIQRKQALQGKTPNFSKETEDTQNPGSYWDYSYSDLEGDNYHIVTEYRTLSREELIEKLSQHPEGIMIYRENNPMHAIIITHFEKKDDGTIQFYAYDPVNSRGDMGEDKKGIVTFEDTWHYSAGGTLDNYQHFSYIE